METFIALIYILKRALAGLRIPLKCADCIKLESKYM